MMKHLRHLAPHNPTKKKRKNGQIIQMLTTKTLMILVIWIQGLTDYYFRHKRTKFQPYLKLFLDKSTVHWSLFKYYSSTPTAIVQVKVKVNYFYPDNNYSSKSKSFSHLSQVNCFYSSKIRNSCKLLTKFNDGFQFSSSI